MLLDLFYFSLQIAKYIFFQQEPTKKIKKKKDEKGKEFRPRELSLISTCHELKNKKWSF